MWGGCPESGDKMPRNHHYPTTSLGQMGAAGIEPEADTRTRTKCSLCCGRNTRWKLCFVLVSSRVKVWFLATVDWSPVRPKVGKVKDHFGFCLVFLKILKKYCLNFYFVLPFCTFFGEDCPA